MRTPLLIWSTMLLLLAGFWLWHGGTRPPLAPNEVERYLARMEANAAAPERIELIRDFLANDDGAEFFMVNLLRLRAEPLQVGAVVAGERSEDTLARYTDHHFLRALHRRGGYVVIAGPAVSGNIEAWGFAPALAWPQAGVVRYRSRRDMMELATDPRFADAHQYKLAALEATLAFPIGQAFNPMRPTLLVAVILIAVGALLQLMLTSTARRAAGTLGE